MFRRFTTLRYNYPNPLDQQRAQALLRIILALIISAVIGLFFLALDAFQRQDVDELAMGIISIALVSYAFLWWILQQGRLQLVRYGLVGILVMISLTSVTNGLGDSNDIIIMLPVVGAGVLLEWRGLLVTYVVLIGLSVFGTVSNPPADWIATLGLFNLILFLVIVLFVIFSGSLQRLAQRFSQDIQIFRQLVSAPTLGYAADEEMLMNRTIDAIRDYIPQTFAQIFLVDSQGRISQRVYTGIGLESVRVDTSQAGQIIPAVLQVFNQRQVLSVTRQDSAALQTHFLPGVQISIVLPIMSAEQVLGVLDVQTENVTLINENILTALRVVTNQLGINMGQMRRQRDLLSNVQEQQVIIARQRGRLRELEQREQRQVAEDWDNYFANQTDSQAGFDFDLGSGQVIPAHDLPDAVIPTLESGQVFIEKSQTQQTISLPILLRGQLIGAMAFTMSSARPLSQRQIDLLENVVQRLALALENRRLLERTQAQANRERQANEIANRLLSTTDVVNLVQIAAQNFQTVMGAVQTRVHIQPEKLTDGGASS